MSTIGKRRGRIAVAATVAMLLVVGCSSAARRTDPLPLRKLASIALPGAATRFDYESLDPKTHLLFLAHLAASEVVVYDVKSDRIVATIPHIDSVHGVLAVSELGRVYATATGTNEVVVIDAHTFAELARVPGGSYPDGMAYDPDDRKLYVSDERGGTDTVIDTTSNRRVATIALGGDVGNTQYDARGHRIYVNVQSTGRLVAIDPTKDRVVASYPVDACASNHGLLIDDEHRKAFIACEGNATLRVFDLTARKFGESFAVGDDPDVLAYDVTQATLYVAAETGTLAMFAVGGANVTKIGEGFLGKNAHIVAVDQATHRVYLPVLGDAGPTMSVMIPTARATPNPA